MGNIISSFVSGFAKVISDLFGSPLDFLAGKSCSSACGSTWDFICYIENFCVAHLLKMTMVLVLLYIVLLFFYLLHKMGICECVSRSLCKMIWVSLGCCFHAWEYCCIFLWVKLHKHKRVNRERRRDIEEGFETTSEEEYDDEERCSYHVPRPMDVNRSVSYRWRDYRGAHLRKSLRPRSHRVRVGISRDSSYGGGGGSGRRNNHIKHGNHVRTVHDIRVTRTSKFAHKGRSYKGGAYHRQKW